MINPYYSKVNAKVVCIIKNKGISPSDRALEKQFFIS